MSPVKGFVRGTREEGARGENGFDFSIVCLPEKKRRKTLFLHSRLSFFFPFFYLFLLLLSSTGSTMASPDASHSANGNFKSDDKESTLRQRLPQEGGEDRGGAVIWPDNQNVTRDAIVKFGKDFKAG